MAILDDQRHQMIQRTLMRRPDAIVDSTIQMWERLHTELTSIIGEVGFQSLYARSIHQAQISFPWLMAQNASDFFVLRNCLEKRDGTEASAASSALLNIFSDTLILLIGELLTTSILRSAWGDDILDIAGKEPQ